MLGRVKAACRWIGSHRLLVAQIATYICGKILLAVIELPQYEKEEAYVAELLIGVCFYLAALVLKWLSLPKRKGWEVLKVNLQSFLLWIVALLMIIFSFSLSHALNWSSLQIGLLVTLLLLQTQTLVLLCNWRFTSRIQFVVYQLIMAVSIVALGIKTVIFVELQSASPHKDIVLLNLTTQIAFAILLMDSMERAYKRFLAQPPPRQLQQELAIST